MQKLAEICVRRPVFATMLIMTLMVLGVYSYSRLTIERFPKVEFPTITVTTVLPGAAPQEVETEITDKIEKSLNTISGIDTLRSTSSEGVSLVFVTFGLDKDLDVAAQDVRDKLNLALPDLPDGIDQPTVQRLDPDSAPIMTISVSANRSMREITEYSDKVLRRQLESVDGVGEIKLVGSRKRQINVKLDGDKLRAYNLSVAQVTQSLKSQNLEVPGGRIEQQDRTLTLRTLGRLQSPAEFNNVVVTNRNGYPIKISDIGYTEDGEEDERSVGRLNNTPALLLQVRRQSGTSVIDVIDVIKERLAAIKSTLPPGYEVKIVRDQSIFILAAFNTVKEHLILGSILATLVVLLFMQNIRATIISGIAIPTSIIATFAAMDYFGITLNGPSMLGLTLAVGIVIDDAIVVLENIVRFIEEKGYSPFEAAVEATREIGLAVMATTLSLVVIFLPMAFMPSIAGKFFKSVSLTMVFAILVSLLVSFTLTPMMSARMLKRVKKKTSDTQGEPQALSHTSEKQSWIMRVTDSTYTVMLKFSMRHRWVVVVTALLVFVSIYPLFKGVGKDFFPQDDQDEFEVVLRAPEGTSVQKTLSITQEVATAIRKLPHIQYTLTTVGDDAQKNSNLAKVYVRLDELSKRKLTQFDLMKEVREKVLSKYSKTMNLRASVNAVATISGGGFMNADIAYELRGPNLDKLNEYSKTLLSNLREMPGIVDADTSLIIGKPEVQIVVDRQKASDLGVSVGDIAQSLRLLVGGDQISTYNENGEQYEVHVRSTENFRTDMAGIGKLNVPSLRVGSIGLDSVVEQRESTGPTQIERVTRQRKVLLTANLKQGYSQSDILARLDRVVKDLNMPVDYKAQPEGRAKELGKTMRGFILAFVLSIIFMYIVLAMQFESFIHPVTVLFALPLCMPFAIFSLYVTGQSFNIFTALGLLVLFGMVKKNSILQIDHMNGLRRKGMARYDAIIQASRDRLRPILMTTIAFVAGMLPLAVSSGPGSGINRSTSVIVIGGQTLCLLLTLLFTPVMYSIFDDMANSSIWSVIKAFAVKPKLEKPSVAWGGGVNEK